MGAGESRLLPAAGRENRRGRLHGGHGCNHIYRSFYRGQQRGWHHPHGAAHTQHPNECALRVDRPVHLVQGGGRHAGARGHHPAIRAAIGALERAKADMQAAAHDFGGHRVDAIAACDAAIAQLRLALQYANNPAGTPTAPPNP